MPCSDIITETSPEADGTNRETNSQIMFREQQTWKHLTLNEMSPSNPSSQFSGTLVEEKGKSVRGNEGHQRHKTSKHSRTSVFMNSQILAAFRV